MNLEMSYAELVRKEIRFTNRILSFDRKYWDRRNGSQIAPKNETELALILIQGESYAFLRGIKSSVKENNLRAAGSLLRSLLESTANAYWITEDKTGKRATRYVATTDSFSEYLENVKANNLVRIPEAVRSWTSSSAEDRLKAFSPQAGMVWDYCSIFIHPSPTYLSLHPGAEKVLHYVIGQANTYALTARHIMLDKSELYNSKERKYLDMMAAELLLDKLSINQRTLS